jgi:hypothetical protein
MYICIVIAFIILVKMKNKKAEGTDNFSREGGMKVYVYQTLDVKGSSHCSGVIRYGQELSTTNIEPHL